MTASRPNSVEKIFGMTKILPGRTNPHGLGCLRTRARQFMPLTTPRLPDDGRGIVVLISFGPKDTRRYTSSSLISAEFGTSPSASALSEAIESKVKLANSNCASQAQAVSTLNAFTVTLAAGSNPQLSLRSSSALQII